MMRPLIYCILLIGIVSCGKVPVEIKKRLLSSDTDALLQAISIVDEKTAWVSGHDATILRTVDGGESWEVFQYEKEDTLQFRDVHAFDHEHIILMSAGMGRESQIFEFNIHSGFRKAYQMEDSLGFLNTIEFWDANNGLAFGDSFNGRLFVLKTVNGGKDWNRIDPALLPLAGKGEGGFAASGTCITTRPGGKAWIGTGAGGNSRVLYTENYGQSWQEYQVPMVKGPSAGIFSIRMLNDKVGSIVGGDLERNDQYTNNIAFTTDGGKNWKLSGQPVTKGPFYGSDFISVREGKSPSEKTYWIASGPNGIDYSLDKGLSFANLDTAEYWAVDCHESGFGYAVGRGGKILKINF